MPDWVAWLGVICTIGFGVLSLIQYVEGVIAKRVRASERAHVLALGQSLSHIRSMCTEAIESGEIIKTDAAKQFVRQIGWSMLTAEAHVAAIEKSLAPKKETKTLQQSSGSQ